LTTYIVVMTHAGFIMMQGEKRGGRRERGETNVSKFQMCVRERERTT